MSRSKTSPLRFTRNEELYTANKNALRIGGRSSRSCCQEPLFVVIMLSKNKSLSVVVKAIILKKNLNYINTFTQAK